MSDTSRGTCSVKMDIMHKCEIQAIFIALLAWGGGGGGSISLRYLLFQASALSVACEEL